jgi:hypothetical protein
MDKKELTKKLAFLCMSDAGLTMHSDCVNASFHLSMCKENRDMAEYAIKLLNELGVGHRYSENEKYFRLDSRTHPFLTTLWDRIYQMGRRVPSPHDFKLLDWEAIAIMYMCDGNIQKGGKRWYPMINTCKWSYAELCWVKQQFKKAVGLDVNIYKCGKYWRVGVPAHQCNFFFENIKPHMLHSFSYKLPSEREAPCEG